MSYYGESILSEGDDAAGVQRIRGEQSTDAAAREALKEQQFGDEFKPQTNPDIEVLVARLNELETEQSNLCIQLYGPPMYAPGQSYKGPPYLEKERIHRRLSEVEEEMDDIKVKLRSIVDAMGLNREMGSPFIGAARVIGG